MNEEQQTIFSKLLDVNFELSQKKDEAIKLQKQFNQLEEQLRLAMGEAAYTDFIEAGKKVFAPV